MSTFRFQARNAFLTYPQANNISIETLLAFLKGLDDCEKVVVAMEEHETEGVHYHALVQFTKKKRTRNQAYFDYEGNHPNIQIPRNLKDVFDYVTKDNNFINDGWDLMIAHPPCTYLARSGGRWWKYRKEEQEMAIEFVKFLINAPIDKIAIENPIGILSTVIRKPDQIIQPWMFGHGETKATCLWLKNLAFLI